MDYNLIWAVVFSITLLLILILHFKIQAFIALLISSISVGIIAGMEPAAIIQTMQEGMGNTLGFVAMVVGLGAMFGAILEHSGGAESLAQLLLKKFGEKRASWALMLTGFFVAIPVFFDVAFIILVPLVYALQRKSKKSILLYGLPLLAGLAITHAFVPPTPGPVAVADILKADLGWVIFFGFIVGIPTSIVCGPLFSKYIASKIHVDAPEFSSVIKSDQAVLPNALFILFIIAIPILLILINTLINSSMCEHLISSDLIKSWIGMIGHPFSALIIANLLAWYFLGIKGGFNKEKLLDITTKSMGPAGIIILLTGAGGVFKQMLVNTGTGEMLAIYFAEQGVSVLFFAFISAAIVRLLQGSATVAMITAAGLTAPLIMNSSPMETALLVIAIASGASTFSHVNDSGFWLVSKYLGLTEKQTFRSWTMMTGILSLVGFGTVILLSLLI